MVVDAVPPLDLAIEVRCPRPNVEMPDVARLELPVKLRLELGAIMAFVGSVSRRLALLGNVQISQSCANRSNGTTPLGASGTGGTLSAS